MLSISKDLDIIEHEKFLSILNVITNEYVIDTISSTIDEKNPGRDSYTSDGGSFSITYKYVGNTPDKDISTIASILISAQNAVDTARHFLISGFIDKRQYAHRKNNALGVASLLINNIIGKE